MDILETNLDHLLMIREFLSAFGQICLLSRVDRLLFV